MGRKLVNKFQLSEELSTHIDNDTGIVLIGSLVWWDKTAPMIGSILKNKYKIPNVYGTYENPITALNLEERILNIKHNKIIAIDSGVRVGNTHIGEILIGDIPIKPGLGIGKNLMSVGDVSIVAVTVEQNRALCDYKQYGSAKEENIINGLVCNISWAINDAYKKSLKSIDK